MEPILTWTILVALSLLPPLVFLFWWRARERHEREPVKALLRVFAYGGTIGVVVAVILHIVLEIGYASFSGNEVLGASLLSAVVIAPVVEELSKGLGLPGIKRELNELEDGIVYGAALGLGFAATENFVYGYSALLDAGLEDAIVTIVLRVFSAMLLHAAASALIGFGYGLIVLRNGALPQLLPFYLIAVLLHGVYNFLVGTAIWAGFVIALILVYVVISQLAKRIRELDTLPHEVAQTMINR